MSVGIKTTLFEKAIGVVYLKWENKVVSPIQYKGYSTPSTYALSSKALIVKCWTTKWIVEYHSHLYTYGLGHYAPPVHDKK